MLKDSLIDCGAIKFGHFVLTSGKESNYYVDIKQASTNPKVLQEIADEMANLAKDNDYQVIAGMELGAVPLAVALALKTQKPYVIIRKEKPSHGTGKQLVGNVEAGQRVLLVEDVATTGGSVVKAIDALLGEGLTVDKVLVVVDREEGASENLKDYNIQILPLVKASDLK
ncbi:orotate phosphoribosyltransferase [[Eubacterium] cellulosolvens]